MTSDTQCGPQDEKQSVGSFCLVPGTQQQGNSISVFTMDLEMADYVSSLNLRKNRESRTRKTTVHNSRITAGTEELLHKKEQVDSLFPSGIFLYPDLTLISLTMTIIWIFAGFKSMLSGKIDKSCRVDIALEQRWKLLNIS